MTNPSLSHIAPATLHLVCGKIGAGKSTLCAKLAEQPTTVLVSEDSWLATLYPGEITALTDYVRCSSRLKTAMAEHVLATSPTQRFALSGHSMGGRVAFEVMRLAPERVERLSLG